MDVAGLWRLWRPRVLAVEDGETIARRDRVDFYVARNAPWRLLVVTRECDFGALGSAAGPGVALFPCPLSREVGGSGEDAPGLVLDRYRSPAAALGLHRSNARLEGSSCPPSNRLGCYRLTYSVERIEDEGLRARHTR